LEERKFIANGESEGSRLDVFLAQKCSDLSRSRIQKLIKDGHALVNGKTIKPNFTVSEGDEIRLAIPELKELEVIPQEIPFQVVYEDADLMVVNKPQGMVVHPAAGNYEGTLVNALLHYCQDLSGINGVLRPGIVHRIDKDTSGLLLVAKNDFAHQGLAEQIKEHSLTRVYRAIVHGNIPEPAGVIDAPIGRHPIHRKKMAVVLKNSKKAVTHYRVLERFKEYTYIEAKLETGRTHQIRVHMSYLGYPVVGDPLYGPKKCKFNLKGQALHAAVIGFIHPQNGKYMEFTAPLPPYFQELLEKLRHE